MAILGLDVGAPGGTIETPPRGPLGLNGGSEAGHSRIPGPIGMHSHPSPHKTLSPHEPSLSDRQLKQLRNITSGNALQRVAVELLGPSCFSAGVIAGIGTGIINSAVELIKLVSTFVLAELYGIHTQNQPWWKSAHPIVAGTRALMAGAASTMLEKEIKTADEERHALLKELGKVLQNPQAVFEGMLDNVAEEYKRDWRAFNTQLKTGTLEGQFDAGMILGQILLDVLALMTGVGGALKTSAKLATKAPHLAKWAKRIEIKSPARKGPRQRARVGGAASSGNLSEAAAQAVTKARSAEPKKIVSQEKTVSTKVDAAEKTDNAVAVPLVGAVSGSNSVFSRRAYLNEKFDRTGDTNLDINIKSRQETAFNFYKSQGVDEIDIPSHLTGIDFTQPVDIIAINSGKKLLQFQTRGAPQGNYYSLSEHTLPTHLGISPNGFNRSLQIVEPKIRNEYVTSQKINVLKSQAASVDDFWSVKGDKHPTVGGGHQIFSGQQNIFDRLNR
ncbi:MAG: hypothetical protein JKY01_11510 [Pseudomonadales bacterium]|nr:hypothetical protein [Pseudomonadales bacterium]